MASTFELVEELELGAEAMQISFHPAGNRLVTTSGVRVVTWEWETGGHVQLINVTISNCSTSSIFSSCSNSLSILPPFTTI